MLFNLVINLSGLFKATNENASFIEKVDIKLPFSCKNREKKPKKTREGSSLRKLDPMLSRARIS